jgi:hypothetical protein
VRKPLNLPLEHWRSRWLVLPSWRALHRVSEIAWEDSQMISGEGVTVCGRRGNLQMPGLFSRTGLKRCSACCRALNIPTGEGAPFSQKDLDDTQRNA